MLDEMGSQRVHSFETLYVIDAEARELANELISEVPA